MELKTKSNFTLERVNHPLKMTHPDITIYNSLFKINSLTDEATIELVACGLDKRLVEKLLKNEVGKVIKGINNHLDGFEAVNLDNVWYIVIRHYHNNMKIPCMEAEEDLDVDNAQEGACKVCDMKGCYESGWGIWDNEQVVCEECLMKKSDWEDYFDLYPAEFKCTPWELLDNEVNEKCRCACGRIVKRVRSMWCCWDTKEFEE